MRRRLIIYGLVVIAGVYVTLCVVARIAYPRMLFPAPRLDAPPPVEAPARLIELAQTDGSHTAALHWPPTSAGARTVVMFHGNGETIFDDVALAGELTRRGFGVLLVEYRGYGTTYGPPPTEAMLYEDGEAAIAHLTREQHLDPDRIALWGWSLGTAVAVEMARRGHGSRVVLLAPFTSVAEMARRVAPILPVSFLLSHRLDTLSKASDVKQRTLVIHGDADEVIPFAMGEAVAAAIPQARFVPVRGGHHMDLLTPMSGSPDAKELLDAIVLHLDGD